MRYTGGTHSHDPMHSLRHSRWALSALILATTVLPSVPLAQAAAAPRAFLSIPFAEADRDKLAITEGWKYSAAEKAIHGYATHYGVDFAAARGTPVYAAAAGYAISSVQIGYGRDYQGKRIGFALGRFVQIYHPYNKTYTSYSHLDSVAPGIPYVAPKKGQDAAGRTTYDPTVVYQPVQDMLRQAKFVQKGQLIGTVGDSGLSWGYEEGLKRPDPATHPSWDETHLHFEVYTRGKGGSKRDRYDPFGVYGEEKAYQAWTETDAGLWLNGKDGKVRWARK